MSNNYTGLRSLSRRDPEAAKRCAANLKKIRARHRDVRARKKESSLLLATWNIRDFDSNKFKFGPRLPESIYYIAEFLSLFDLIAVQEVNEDLEPLEQVMRVLGREWDYIVTDITEGTGGNKERMAFIFNVEKVYFRKVAGEVVLPNGQLIVSRKRIKKPKPKPSAAEDAPTDGSANDEAEFEETKLQFARSPFLVSFQSGWFRFNLCTVHIYFGDDSGSQLEQRIEEIKRLVDFFVDRQNRENIGKVDEPQAQSNYILLGDFNVVSPEHETMKALKRRGFVVPEAIDGNAVRKLGNHFYDQIAVRVKDPRFKVVGGGLLDLYEDVFAATPETMAVYAQHLPDSDPEPKAKYRAKTPEALFEKWRTWQLSDHAPLWIEIETDYAEHYLDQFVEKAAPGE